MPYYRRAAVMLALLPALLTGCKSADKPAQGTTKATRLFAVSIDSAAFFRQGPREGRDPDLTLPKDTVVKLIRPSLGYSKIQIVTSGLQGYVASDEIRPATATLLAAATISPAHTSGPTSEQFNLNSNDPRLVPPPEDLPDPDLPAPAPEP